MKKIDIKLGRNFTKFFQKIKPKSSKNLKKKEIQIICDIIFGLVKGQKCFLNSIVSNMKHYKDSLWDFANGTRRKALSKTAQIAKISQYLSTNIYRFKQKFVRFVFSTIRFSSEIHSFETLKSQPIQQRVFSQALLLHDTTDIQKPHAKKMERVSQARDGSTHKSWKWYYAEGTVLFVFWRIKPLLLTLFSSKDETDAKNINRANREFLRQYAAQSRSSLYQNSIHVYDRGYDVSSFMGESIELQESFIIRWVKSRGVICPEYYEQIKLSCTTQTDRVNIFSRVENFTKEMEFETLPSHPYYEIAFKPVLKKWENAHKELEDVIPVILVVIRLSKNSGIEWIEEDLQTYKNAWEDFEKEFYFYTNLNITNAEDALIVFYLYLKRRKIETWFRYLKQVFDLEKMKILAFQKLKNLCELLVIASYYLYDTFYGVLHQYEELSEKSVEGILEKEEREKKERERKEWEKEQKNSEKLFSLFLLKYYSQYCIQKNLKLNPDSFARFIFHETGTEIIYCEEVVIDSW